MGFNLNMQQTNIVLNIKANEACLIHSALVFQSFNKKITPSTRKQFNKLTKKVEKQLGY